MLRKTLFAFGVAAVFGLSLQFGGPAEASANYFTVTQACAQGGVGVDATVNWQGTSAGARETWIDVSEFNNGWVPDTYATSGAISPNQTSFKWVSLLPNTAYYVRVSQLLAPGYWDPSWTYMFVTGPACYGVNTPSFSTPWYGPGTYATAPYGGMPYGTATYSTSPSYSSSSSFSLQPVDAWVRQAINAMYTPGAPMYINCYPGPEPGCHLP